LADLVAASDGFVEVAELRLKSNRKDAD